MKVSTYNSDGTWTHEEVDLGEDFEKKMAEDLKEIERLQATGELAKWCECGPDGECRSVMDRYVVSFDYRTGDEGNPDVPQNLGASHGCYCTKCNGVVQTG